MKSVIIKEKTEKEEDKYPCLKESKVTGNVILFCSEHSGTLLVEGEKGIGKECQSIGTQGENWIAKNFIPFTDSIRLSN